MVVIVVREIEARLVIELDRFIVPRGLLLVFIDVRAENAGFPPPEGKFRRPSAVVGGEEDGLFVTGAVGDTDANFLAAG